MSDEQIDREALAAMVGAIPEPDGTQPMSAAEFRMVRDWLGVSGEWLAAHLEVGLRSVRRWESGHGPTPDGVRVELEQLEAIAAAQVDTLCELLEAAPVVTLRIPTGELGRWPAGWWRMIAARCAQNVPGLYVGHGGPGC